MEFCIAKCEKVSVCKWVISLFVFIIWFIWNYHLYIFPLPTFTYLWHQLWDKYRWVMMEQVLCITDQRLKVSVVTQRWGEPFSIQFYSLTLKTHIWTTAKYIIIETFSSILWILLHIIGWQELTNLSSSPYFTMVVHEFQVLVLEWCISTICQIQ